MIQRLLSAWPRSRRVQWWVAFAFFTLLATAWALAGPLFAGPDEPEHVRRAASVAHGELIGPTRRGEPDHVRVVEIPGPFARAQACFVFKPDTTAACEINIDRGEKGPVQYLHATGRYPPTPFAAVGLPSIVWPSRFGVYVMRLLGAALCGALFASALLSLRETRVPWLAVSGFAFALTPMVIFVSSVVNPSNLEIAGGLGFWASGLALVSKARDGVVDDRLVARAGIAAAVLVLARPLGMLWLAIATVVLLLAGTWPSLIRLLRSRVVQVWAGVVGLCLLSELAWILFYDTLGSKVPPGESATGLSDFEILKETFASTNDSYRHMIGVFGWLDTPSPPVTYISWAAALGVLVALALVLTTRRMAALIAGLAASIVVVPAVLEFIEAQRFGFGWQGRYTLPLAVGLPILCGFALSRQSPRILQRGRVALVLGAALTITFVVAHFAAFAVNLQRYTVGLSGGLLFWRHPQWSPPVSPLLLLVAYAVLLVALASWLWVGAVAGPSAGPADEDHDARVTDLPSNHIPGLEYTRSG
jgi:Predicted membrane protein (DUF2142)